VEIVPTTGATATEGQAGGRGGFGRGGLTGTVTAIADGSISISTADGQTFDVTTDATTTWTSQAEATADAVVPGASIRVTTAGGFGRGQQSTDASTPQTATDIEVLLPAAS
jgi:hypothetical protein